MPGTERTSARGQQSHDPSPSHKTQNKGENASKHLVRKDTVISMKAVRLLLPASWATTNEKGREREYVMFDRKKRKEGRGDKGRRCRRDWNYMHPINISSYASLWLLLLFITLLMTIAVSSTDLLASYIQQGAFKLIRNTEGNTWWCMCVCVWILGTMLRCNLWDTLSLLLCLGWCNY